MKWQRFFLILLLIPALVLGLDKDKCKKIHEKVTPEWKQHNELIEESNRLNENEIERSLQLLKASLECCRRAVAHCDTILKDIASKSKSERKKTWRRNMKSSCEQDKKRLEAEIKYIQSKIETLETQLASVKTQATYERSLGKAAEATNKDRACQRRLDNIDEVVTVLNEVSKLFEEAVSIAREALAIISPYPSEAKSQEKLKKVIENYQQLAERYKKDALGWPASVAAQKTALREEAVSLQQDSQLLTKQGLGRNGHELQKQAVATLQQLLACSAGEEAEGLKAEIQSLKAALSTFEEEADTRRLTDNTRILSSEEFKAREKERKLLFYKSDFLLGTLLFQPENLRTPPYPRVVALDGQTGKKEGDFVLYTEQFYRFLVQSDDPIPELFIKVYENGQVVHAEAISLPFGNTQGWEKYLTNGMLFAPVTKLISDFGLDLRLTFFHDPKNPFSMIVSQRGRKPRYRFSISIDQEKSLYVCQFSIPPPWQLETLRKPSLTIPNRPIDQIPLPPMNLATKENREQLHFLEALKYPALDQLVEKLKKDPLAIAAYVQNEIALVDPYLHQENGIFYAPSIHRNPGVTYLEGQGSPWEQCQLLAYLMRKAGFQAVYAVADSCRVPKSFFEKMLLTKLPEEQTEVSLKYPWVVFFDGKEWISLFPWMKEIQVHEGHDLYQFMPEEYATAHRWILGYLKGDEKILKHIGPDANDTAGILFVRFVEEEMRTRGLSLRDIGVHRTQLKKQYSSWQEFLHPSVQGLFEIYPSLDKVEGLFAQARVEVCSRENPSKKLELSLPLAHLSYGISSIHFTSDQLHLQIASDFVFNPLELDGSDHLIDVKIACVMPVGTQGYSYNRAVSVAKGTSAALCSHFGGASSKTSSQFYEQFSTEKDQKNRISALLSFVGASYFEKCSRSNQALCKLHKINPATAFAFGLSKFSPDPSKAPFKGDEDLSMPQVDMFWFQAVAVADSHSERAQCQALLTVDSSSNEHQILREVFSDQYAISTVKLLQLAHLQHQRKGLESEGFLNFTAESFEHADRSYFFFQNELNFREIKAASPGQWKAIKDQLDRSNPLSRWSYAFLTPGLTWNQNRTYKEMGALILSPYQQYALISNNNLIFNGGLGSPLPPSFFTTDAVREWQLIPRMGSYTDGYTLALSPQFTSPTSAATITSLPGTNEWASDIRPWYKTLWSTVSDPIDTVTGAFYIDETDLVLPGTFPLSIRRNYNSQNPLIGDLGCGWKLSLNPFLVEQDGKRFAAELDGTVIVYSCNPKNGRWEVVPENNPELFNFGQRSPFHSYIENDVLHGSDGSKRFFENGLVQKWVDVRGNALFFSYKIGRLSRIESSNGDFCGIDYNHDGNISEIYTKDGRRILYDYDSQRDLVKVTLPNTAEIIYEYDRRHRVIRETKPHGKVLENIYDDQGRVKQQRSPMGPQQEMVVTATFDYTDAKTIVIDAQGARTTYQIHDKQIYKITDPLGFTTLQAWFIDKKSWFDPETQQVLQWHGEGGAVRSLKFTTDKRGLTTSYLYDERGNPEIITLQGEDLTGSGHSKLTKKLTHNERNLCIEEKIDGQKTLTTYDSNFPYLPKKIEKYNQDTLTSYALFDYNTLGHLEKEDHSGSVTLWKYNEQGFPCQRIQVTGTQDPDVVTLYGYNRQGQCTEITSADGIQKNRYDLIGNLTESKTFSPTGELISATYIGYDLNSAPIWRQTANAENIVFLDYHASGLVKARGQLLAPSRLVAYTLYDYDLCGYLIEETDPRGYATFRDYDLLGRLKAETNEGHTTLFSYEPGGLHETVTSPSGATITHHYTTNGLLKEEIYPDGTKNTTIYDFVGRPVLETKNDIAWEIKYDDAHHRVTRIHLKTNHSEISEFDQRGNLIRFTDAAGYTSTKTYDGLNRLKSETTPSGKQTLWSYQNDLVICALPSGETTTIQYTAGRGVKTEVTDSKRTLIAASHFRFDPENETEEVIAGEERTVTRLNALGLPIKIEKGEITATHEYDACGNCILSIDGDGRATRREFDGLGRLAKKQLPDGITIKFAYDLDSNLSEHHLPNGNLWKASYDSVGRKKTEELISSTGSSELWTFSYENGYLVTATDPMQRAHTYFYDHYGRVSHDIVQGGKRVYTYDPRGRLATADQTIQISSSWFYTESEHSLVERSYDEDGNLALESIYLNSNLFQQTLQKWTPSSRSLQIGDHVRDFTYRNNQLVQVSTQHTSIDYSYDLSGALKSKNDRFISSIVNYNLSGLPETILTHLPQASQTEQLGWYASGKLNTHTAPNLHQTFSYDERGYLKSTNSERYDFDFSSPGTGVRTAAPGWFVPQNGLDDFGRVLASVFNNTPVSTQYNEMGEVVLYDDRQLSWDPWGKLIKITNPSSSWEASYDALGRRLQSRYTKSSEPTLITNSLYDPETEFQEIGVQVAGKTFWKIYGPDACDAITDEMGASVSLIHNALRQLTGIVSSQGTLYTEKLPSAYGPLETTPPIPSDLISYAQSLSWQSKAQDPTGFIWMGARYYDPINGRFLSHDPVSYPFCLDLYAYANGDPINYFDPDGRFASPAYRRIEANILDLWHDPRFHGSLQAFGGFMEGVAGSALSGTPFAPLGFLILAHGADNFAAGINTVATGRCATTMTEQLLQKAGVSPEWASFGNNVLSVFSFTGSASLLSNGVNLATHSAIETSPMVRELGWSRGAENLNAAPALRSKLSGLQKAQGSAAQVRNLPDGRFRYYSLEVFASKQGLTRGTSYVTEWNPRTGQVKSWMESYDHFGRVNRVHPKMINGRLVDSIHYPPIGKEIRTQ